MRSPSVTLLTFAALSASLAEGAALPQVSSGSPSSSRRSSIASTTSVSHTTTTTTASSSSSSSPTSTKPVFNTDVFATTSTSSATRRSSTSLETISTSSVAQGRAGFAALQKPGITTSSSTSTSTTMRRSSSLLNPMVTTAPITRSTSTLGTMTSSKLAAGGFQLDAAIQAASSSVTVRTISSSTAKTSSSTSSTAMASNLVFGKPQGGALVMAASTTSASVPTSTAVPVAPTSSLVTSSSASKSSTVSSLTSSKAVSTSSSVISSSSAKAATTSSKAATTLAASSSLSPISSATSSPKLASTASLKANSAPATSVPRSTSTMTLPTPSSTAIKAATSSAVSPSSSTAAPTTSKAAISSSATKTTSSATTSASASATVSVAPVDFGCWYDTSDDRTMTGASYVDSNGMTTESCASFCTAHGMPFSGTEYGDECYCSETAPTSSAAWWCNMPCPGNSTEICGSGDALSVLYTAPTTVANTASTALGCFADSSDERTMTGASYTSSAMTNEACVTFCTIEGYQYSGTEYGSQCYCSNSKPWSAPVGCSMACSGNSGEICGDGDALSVTFTSNATTTSSASAAATTSASAVKLNTTVDLDAKFESWSTWKARGVNLGNWLVLEQWMYPTWFDNTAPGAVDEWTFCETLGANATTALQQHWATFMTQSDIATMASMDVNTLRIPIGFWAFIDPLDSEPYVRSTQLTELTRVLGYAQTYGMTVVLDIHGLPGSQNGKDHSGHLGDIEFYTDANQARALAAVQAAATWIAGSGYAGSVISSLEVANEPAIADWSVWLQYKDYVLAAHQIVQATVPSVATMFHDGFWPLAPWNQFFKAGDNAVIDTHKYWAFEPTTLAQAESDVCTYVETFAAMNIPVFVGEFSLSVSADVSSFVGYAIGFFESQMSVWLQAAGAAFWSVKVIEEDGSQNAAWSAEGILQSGILNGVDVWSFSESACT